MKEKKQKTKKTPSKKKVVFLSILAVVLCYVLVTLTITLVGVIGMVIQNKHSRGVELGASAYQEAKEQGAKDYYALYSDEEIKADYNLCIPKVYHIPAKTTQKTDYVLIVPGGGYFECDINKVALPCASQVVEKGYTAFVLTYRYGKYSSKYAPMQDIAKAVRFITDNADELNVNTENYAVIGYSAGGNLAGLFGSKDLGYQKYDLPKPKALMLVYPWNNINDTPQVTGNMWQDLITFVGKTRANKIVLGSKATKQEKESLCVQNHVDSDYPATFIITGNKDNIVNHERNSVIFDQALEQNGVRHQLVIADGLNHGFGLGLGTNAEGWVQQALTFWKAE